MLYSSMKGDCSQAGVGLFSQVRSDKAKGHGLKLHQERFKLDIRKNVFIEMSSFKGCPGNLRESPSPEVFRGHGDVVLRDTV